MSLLPPAGRFSQLLNTNQRQDAAAIWDTRLIESDNFVAAPTKGSVVPGWLLLIPKRHVFSFKQLTASELAEARVLVERISMTLSCCFGPVTIFEHGAAYSGSVLGCGVDHAHLHMVSMSADLVVEALTDKSLHWEPMREWSELHQKISGESEYLMVSNAKHGAFVAMTAPSTSQYFRKLIAKLHGRPARWDYRAHPFAENARATVAAFSDTGICGGYSRQYDDYSGTEWVHCS